MCAVQLAVCMPVFAFHRSAACIRSVWLRLRTVGCGSFDAEQPRYAWQ